MKNINVLIIDDIAVVGECVRKRLAKQNSFFSAHDFRVTPYFFEVKSPDVLNNAREIEEIIKDREINFLLLDRGFSTVIDPSKDTNSSLDKNYLYGRLDDNGFKVDAILKLMNKSVLKNIMGVIIYTYDEDLLLEEADLVNEFSSILPSSCAGKIDVLLTFKDIYHPSGLDLYMCEKVDDEFEIIGKKSDFILYGLQIGEILYHRIITPLRIQKEQKLLTKSIRFQRNLFLILAIFTGLNLGANSLFALVLRPSLISEH